MRGPGKFGLLFLFFLFFSSSSPATEIVRLVENNFQHLNVPPINTIKAGGVSKTYTDTNFENVWHATILVLMQEGILVRSSKEAGVIVAFREPPATILVERGQQVTVYLYWMEDVYKPLDGDEEAMIKFPPEEKEKLANNFFYKLTRQAHPAARWKFLWSEPHRPNSQ